MELIYFTFIGLGTGAVYALVAVGIAVIYSSSKILNFAQGQFVLLGGMIASGLVSGSPASLVLALVIAGVVGGVAGALSGSVIVAPLLKKKADLDLVILGTVGLGIAFENLVAERWGRDPVLVRGAEPGVGLHVGGAVVPWHYLVMLAVAVLIFIALASIFRWTDFGIMLRAAASDLEATQSSGVDAPRLLTMAWGLAGALGAMGGALIGQVVPIQYSIGVPLTVSGFAAAMLGGIDSPVGGFLGGILFGVAESIASAYLPGQVLPAVAPVIMLLVLTIRPTGLIRARATRRV